ncbi:hypothetical protein JTE90_024205, partial [Oedothorax gibbosus]
APGCARRASQVFSRLLGWIPAAASTAQGSSRISPPAGPSTTAVEAAVIEDPMIEVAPVAAVAPVVPVAPVDRLAPILVRIPRRRRRRQIRIYRPNVAQQENMGYAQHVGYFRNFRAENIAARWVRPGVNMEPFPDVERIPAPLRRLDFDFLPNIPNEQGQRRRSRRIANQGEVDYRNMY